MKTTPVDELALRDAIIGDGMILAPSDSGEWDLHAVRAGHAFLLGSNLDTLAAWAVIDAFDLRRGRPLAPA